MSAFWLDAPSGIEDDFGVKTLGQCTARDLADLITHERREVAERRQVIANLQKLREQLVRHRAATVAEACEVVQ